MSGEHQHGAGVATKHGGQQASPSNYCDLIASAGGGVPVVAAAL